MGGAEATDWVREGLPRELGPPTRGRPGMHWLQDGSRLTVMRLGPAVPPQTFVLEVRESEEGGVVVALPDVTRILCETGSAVEVYADTLDGADLAAVDLHRAQLAGMSLKRAVLTNSVLRNACLNNADLSLTAAPPHSRRSDHSFRGLARPARRVEGGAATRYPPPPRKHSARFCDESAVHGRLLPRTERSGLR